MSFNDPFAFRRRSTRWKLGLYARSRGPLGPLKIRKPSKPSVVFAEPMDATSPTSQMATATPTTVNQVEAEFARGGSVGERYLKAQMKENDKILNIKPSLQFDRGGEVSLRQAGKNSYPQWMKGREHTMEVPRGEYDVQSSYLRGKGSPSDNPAWTPARTTRGTAKFLSDVTKRAMDEKAEK